MAQIYGIKRFYSISNNRVIFMAYRKRTTKTTYGKAFRKKTSRGKFAKGTWIKYAYKNGKRVGTVRSRK
jgi:hypothetical protein